MIRLVMVLDKSGSMGGKESDVINGFNAFINKQKKLKTKTTLTTVLFDNYWKILHNNVDLKKIEPITSKEYFVGGTTALLDAVGDTINHVDHQIKKNDKILFVITTDGYENSSFKFSKEQIKELVQHLESEHEWKFIFLGANINSFAEGGSIGIAYSFDTVNTGAGIMASYAAVSDTTSTFRATKGETLDVTMMSKLKDKDKDSTSNP